MAEAFVISAEDDLWRLLEGALSGAQDLPPPDLLRVVGWNPRLLYFPDERVGHSLSPSLAKAVTGFHNSLSRSYAYALYGEPSARLLKGGDVDVLDFQMLVIQGSNGIQVLDSALDRLTKGFLDKLSGRDVTIIIAIFLLLNFSQTTMSDWLHEEYAAKAKAGEQATNLALSEQETKRMEILKSALTQNPPYKPLSSIADEGRVPLLRGTLAYERSNILGTDITREQAAVIASKERSKGEGQRFDGRFEVVDLNTENPDGHFGILRDVKTQQEIRVAINWGELSKQDIDALLTALRNKTCVDAFVNAWVVNGKISNAVVMRANPAK
jgi:hypothetical protein